MLRAKVGMATGIRLHGAAWCDEGAPSLARLVPWSWGGGPPWTWRVKRVCPWSSGKVLKMHEHFCDVFFAEDDVFNIFLFSFTFSGCYMNWLWFQNKLTKIWANFLNKTLIWDNHFFNRRQSSHFQRHIPWLSTPFTVRMTSVVGESASLCSHK